jgi:putative hydrolase of the HAD superfamily
LKTYKHLFFDLDNTLWDFNANVRASFYDIFTQLDLHERINDFEAFLSAYEKNNEQLWLEYRNGKIKKELMRIERLEMTFREFGIDDQDLCSKVGDIYLKLTPVQKNLFPGVHDTLAYLAEKYKLYILTNGFSEIQIQKINNSGLAPYFTKLFMAEMVGYQKPDRRFFEYAIKSVHAHKAQCIIIGDDAENDIRGGWNAGIDQVYFNPQKKPSKVTPTWEIENISELRKIL